MVAVCIIRPTCDCEGTMANCDFGIGCKSAETPPPNNLYVFISSILSSPSLSPEMINTGAAIFAIFESPTLNGTSAKANICSRNFVHFVLSGATASYAAFIGVLSKSSGLKFLNPLFTTGSQPLLLYVEEMITNFLNRLGLCTANC